MYVYELLELVQSVQYFGDSNSNVLNQLLLI